MLDYLNTGNIMTRGHSFKERLMLRSMLRGNHGED